MYKKFLTIVGLIGVGIVGRLVPHLPNMTPITAITIAGSKHVGHLWSVIIPLLAMLASDAVIGFYNWKILLSVYFSFTLIGCVSLTLKKHRSSLTLGLFTLSSSLIFFTITNFSVWLFSPWYEKSIAGLLYAYTLGLPFLKNMMLGDITYTALILGAFALPHAFFTFKNATRMYWEHPPFPLLRPTERFTP